MSEMTETMDDGDYGDAIEQEDFRSFIDEQAVEWGEEADEELDDLSEEEEEEPRGRREGTDVVLQRLRANDPEAARVVSDMQRKMNQNINEWNTLRGEVLSIREELLARKEQGLGAPEGDYEQTEAEPELPEGITEAHLEMFRSMADHLGYIPRSELAEKEQAEKTSSYVQGSVERAYEQYGEEFGTRLEDGSIEIHADVRAKLDKRLKDLQDPTKGVTPLELAMLEFGSQQTPRREPARRFAARRTEAPVNRRPSPNAPVRRSSRGNMPVRIYDPKRGDSPEDVFNRAWALSKRDLAGQR
jgi:hypothetical protein